MFQVALAVGEDDLGNPTADIAVILSLTAGQQVWVEASDTTSILGANTSYGMYSWFSGHIVYAI